MGPGHRCPSSTTQPNRPRRISIRRPATADTGTRPCSTAVAASFLSGTLAFIHEALASDEAILVVLHETKIRQLRHELNGDADRVLFADMAHVGANPARIIQAWQDFLDEHARADNRLWGIGEPIWAGRSAAELAECQRHEELLNVAFSDPEFSLLCPYDTGALGPAVIDKARRSHPFVREAGALRTSTSYPGAAALSAPFDDPLPDPPGTPAVFIFQVGGLRDDARTGWPPEPIQRACQ